MHRKKISIHIGKEVKVGLFSSLALLLLYFGVQYLKGINLFDSVKNYYVVYNNVNQLSTSNPVLLNGLSVGRVSNMKIIQGTFQNKVVVELEIESAVLLHDSTRAQLKSDFLGNRSIILIPGHGEKVLAPQDTLIAEVESGGLFKSLSQKAEPVAANIESTLHKLSLILDNLAVNTKQIEGILNNLKPTPAILNHTLTKVQSSFDTSSLVLHRVSLRLENTLHELSPTLKNAHVFSDSLRQLEVNLTMQQIQQTLETLNTSLKPLQQKNNNMGLLFNSNDLYINLNNLTLRLDTLVKNINNNPKHFFAPLGKRKKKIEKDRTQKK